MRELRRNPRLPALLVCAILLGGGGAPERIVAVGDVHGAYDAFVEILREAELVDDREHWIGGRTVLVQTGDFLEHGPGVRPAMDLLMRLQEEAPEQSGQVVVLLGNHEALNLFADYLDVAGAAYASFADRSSKARRKEAYQR